jgi:hypothetical protein
MAITETNLPGNGTAGPFTYTFPALEAGDIYVSVDGVVKTVNTDYSLSFVGKQITFLTTPYPTVSNVIRIYRVTDDADLAATFYSGAAIRATDLNTNFTQGLYVTQESNQNATQAITTANTALSNSSAAVSTANAASASAAAAVSTANTASSNASAAVATANTASTNASAAVTTANSAAADAATAISTANGAVTTANSAAADAATAISTANTASSNASAAVATANTASTNASNAVTTANTASTAASNAVTTANSAVTTANAADSKADQAISAVANALLFTIVANVAAIPGSPADGDAVEVTDATGIESFTPLSGLPSGFVGDSGLGVRIIYQSAGSTWVWLQYFPQDPDNRYAGPNTAAGTAAAPSIAFGPTDTNTGIYSPGADQVAVATNGTQRLTVDTAATTSTLPIVHPLGAVGTPSITFTGDLNTGFWSPTADTLAASTNGSERLRIDSSGAVFLGNSSSTFNVFANANSAAAMHLSGGGSGSANIEIHGSTHASDSKTITFDTDSSERMRINSSGKLLIGSSTDRFGTKLLVEGTDGTGGATFARSSNDVGPPYSFFIKSRGTTVGSNTIVQSGDILGFIGFYGTDGTSPISGASIQAQVDGTPGTNDMPGRLVFSTTADGASSTTERMRIDNLGRIFTYNANAGNNSLTVASAAAAGTAVANFIGAHGATGVNTGTSSFIVWTNGNVQNTNNSYTAISDIKLKENIVDANSQWDDIKALQVRNYNLKEGQTHRQIGLIAQEVEPLSPGLVYESPDRDEDGNDLGTVTKSVNYSVLYMKAVKALQEAMERIETLEGMVAVNNITIDEQQHQLSTLAARLTALESA